MFLNIVRLITLHKLIDYFGHMHKLYLLLASLLILNAKAQIGGDNVYSFLNVSSSARIAGVAGTALANTDNDAVFGFWNPSLLREEMNGNIVLSYSNMASDINFGEAMYVYGLDSNHTFLAGIKYVSYGEFLLTNTQAQVLGTFTASDLSAQLSYGYKMSERWSFGASLKFINSAYETYNSWGLATDISATYQIPEKRLSMALVFANLGYQFEKYSDVRENLPVNISWAISNKFEHLPFRWMLTFDHLEKLDLTYNDPNNVSKDPITGEEIVTEPNFANKLLRHVIISGELAPSDNFNIQLGYGFRRSYEMTIPTRRSSAGFTFGIGFKISKFRFNYANTNMHVAGRMHHISITTALSNFAKNNTDTP